MIELCDMLIKYCKKLQPQEQKQSEEEEAKQDKYKQWQDEVQKNDQLKKDFTLVRHRRDQDVDDFTVNKKNKKKPQQQQVQQVDEAKNTNALLNHKFDVLGYFENVKVLPPMRNSELDRAIKELEEKREYFKTAEPQKREGKHEGEHKEKHHNEDHKHKRQNAKPIDAQNESEFPKI